MLVRRRRVPLFSGLGRVGRVDGVGRRHADCLAHDGRRLPAGEQDHQEERGRP